MPLDGVSIKCLADELNKQLIDARIDRVSQPDRYDIILQLYKNGADRRLILSANPASPRIHLTTEIRENPSEAPMFVMLLRKHLVGARLIEAVSPAFERIVRLRFDVVNEMGDHTEKCLLIEMMGRHSNIILLNQDDRIHDAILHVDASVNRVREVLPARVYVRPPDQNKLTPQAALGLLNESGSVFRSTSLLLTLDKALLETLQGFSPLLCQEIIFLSGLESCQKPALLSLDEMSRLQHALVRMLESIIQGQFNPTLYFNDSHSGIPVDFHALRHHGYAVQKPAASLSEAMDLFFLEKIRQNTFAQKKQHISHLIVGQLDHARKKLAIHESDHQEGSAYEQHRRMGDLILANLQDVRPDLGSVSAVDYYQPDQPKLLIPLQVNLSASQNAQRYYKMYSKAKTKFTYSQKLIAEDLKDIAYYESIRQALDAASEDDDFLAIRQEIQQAGLGGETRHPPARASSGKRPKKPEKGKLRSAALQPRRYVSSDGLVILAGRNNFQNDELTLKTAHKSDIWLHVQRMPGTHVIIQANRQPVPERTIVEAAEIAAWFSRAALVSPAAQSGQTGMKIAVDYCPVSHVRKPAGARPGMVIYEHYQTVMVTPKAQDAHPL